MKPIAIVSIAAGLFATTAFANTPELFSNGDYADYQADPVNGEVIFNASGCATCHAVDGDDTILAGGQEISTKFGELYAPNITHHKAAGIGGWSNAEFLNAVLRGVSPSGETYFGAVFPYPSYSRMTPEDALDLKAYMASLPVSDAASREHDLSYMSQTILDLWSSSRDPLTPPADAQLARGQYLVEAVGHCAECHTPRDTGYGFKYELDMNRAYEGEFGLLGEYAPDITGTRLANYGPDAFVIGAMAQARKLNGNPMVSTSMRRIARLTSKLSLGDRAAMYAYLTGKPFDVASLSEQDTGGSGGAVPDPEPIVVADNKTGGGSDTRTDATPTGPMIPDYTGAKKLMQRVDAYCEAQAPVEPVTPPPSNAAAPAPRPAGPDPQLVAQADQIIEDYCRACHAPGKTWSGVFPTGDIADMKFDKRVLTPGDPNASPLYESVAAGRMPTGQKMSAEELNVLRDWIIALGETSAPAASTPAQPSAPAAVAGAPAEDVPAPLFAGFSRNERMLAVAADINAIDERDRPYIRYFSFAEMPLAEIDCDDQGALRNPMHYLHAGFNKFINSVSNGPTVAAVVPVDNTEGAVVRIDLRDYDWDFDDWLALSTGVFTQGALDSDFDEEVWEELAQVYPYAVDPESDPLLKILSDATGAYVPIMRADWVARFASEAPYYDMLLDLTGHIRDLERRIGIDVDRKIQDVEMIRAAMLPGSSGVSDHNRMLERFDLPRNGYYWKSYDFAGDDGQQSLALFPDGPPDLAYTPSGTEPFEHDGGEMIFSLENGLQGYYLSDARGARLLVGPASIVSFRTKPIGKGVEIVNARSCFDCHDNGMIAKKDELRDVLLASRRFSRDELEILLEMYVENDVLDEYYQKDRDTFLASLEQLNATSVTAGGQLASLRAPSSVGGGEIVTYLADMHFHALDFEQLARDFYMDVETFRVRAGRLGDPTLTVVVSDWISRLDAGGKIQRSEIEKYYGDILERISDLRPFRYAGGYEAVKHEAAVYDEGAYEEEVEKAVKKAVKKEEEPYEPAVKEPVDYDPPEYEPKADRLTLALHVPKTEVYVNDLLEFTVKANKKCELQIFYVEESKNIEELPGQILGPRFLEAGEERRIPYEGSGLQIRFDEPGKGETMLAFCREGGLGDYGMTAEGALDYAKKHFQPLTRGIAIEAATKVAEDEGQSATNHVTFNVLK